MRVLASQDSDVTTAPCLMCAHVPAVPWRRCCCLSRTFWGRSLTHGACLAPSQNSRGCEQLVSGFERPALFRHGSSPGPQQPFARLACRNIDANSAITGPLPGSWGAAGSASFPALQHLSFSRCRLMGELPASWGSPGGFPSLRQLFLDQNDLTGGFRVHCCLSCDKKATVSKCACQETSLCQLLKCFSNRADRAGTIPASWGGEGVFPALQLL